MKKSIFSCLFIVLLFCLPAVEVQAAGQSAEEKTVIRVGWYEQAGYLQSDGEGNLYGYGKDYLDAIAEYTDWEYEFIEGTREECIRLLEEKKIDLLSPVNQNDSIWRATFTKEIIDNNIGYLYKSEDNTGIGYDDFEGYNNAVVGMVGNTSLASNLRIHREENHFTFRSLRFFSTYEEAVAALGEGQIDLLVADSFVNLQGMKVVGRFSNGQAVFACSSNEIASRMNQAMGQLHLDDPQFSSYLQEFYFSHGSRNHLEYTEEEWSFLEQNPVINVALEADQYPVSYMDENGEAKGIALEVLKLLEADTGIRFQIQYLDSYTEEKELLEEGSVDIIANGVIPSQSAGWFTLGEEHGENDETAGFLHTDGIQEFDLSFIGKKDIDMDTSVRVAVPAYLENGIELVKLIFPQYEYFVFPNDEVAVRSVIEGHMDVTIQSDQKMNELLLYESYQELHKLKYIPGSYVLSFSISHNERILLDILNKALHRVSDYEMNAILNEQIQKAASMELSLEEFLHRYGYYVAGGVLLLVLLIIGQNYHHKYRLEVKNRKRAYRHGITGFASMEKFRLDVAEVLSGEEKEKYYAIAVDIDKFKVINDLYGYDQGDRTIAFLADQLNENLTSRDYLSRTFADNFVILKYAGNLNQVTEYITGVFDKVDEIMQSKKTYYHLILKAGIYHLTEEDNNLSSILDKAGMARASISQNHQSSYQLYREDMREQNIFAKNLENEMKEALKTDQFKVYLQPQVDFETKKIVSAEALVRWKHPDKGMMPPDRFVPIFEKNGFIRKLDYFVWEETIRTIVRWRNEKKIMVPIAINLSQIDLQNEKMVEELQELMERYGLESRWIKVELTESICMEGDEVVLNAMGRLKKLGLQIAVDDFGAGYSSLHLLKKMPIDILKIDKSFLDFDVEVDVKDEIVIRDIVEMGKHLNLQIIMEGVESEEQSVFLKSIGCDIAQGYYFGRPMPVSEFERKLQECYA